MLLVLMRGEPAAKGLLLRLLQGWWWLLVEVVVLEVHLLHLHVGLVW